MSFLRTSYKITGGDIDTDVVGGAYRNWIAQSAIFRNKYGGVMPFSFTSQWNSDGYIVVSAYGVMCQALGSTFVSGFVGSGYKWIPLAFWDGSFGDDGSFKMINIGLSATDGMTASIGANISEVVILGKGASAGGEATVCSDRCFKIVFHGIIVSGPNTPST